MVFQDTLKSLPVWEEWIEMPLTCGRGLISKSLPVWEEWIEISRRLPMRAETCGLFPYGKSGLKFFGKDGRIMMAMSLPVWEEWIEIGTSDTLVGEG